MFPIKGQKVRNQTYFQVTETCPFYKLEVVLDLSHIFVYGLRNKLIFCTFRTIDAQGKHLHEAFKDSFLTQLRINVTWIEVNFPWNFKDSLSLEN